MNTRDLVVGIIFAVCIATLTVLCILGRMDAEVSVTLVALVSFVFAAIYPMIRNNRISSIGSLIFSCFVVTLSLFLLSMRSDPGELSLLLFLFAVISVSSMFSKTTRVAFTDDGIKISGHSTSVPICFGDINSVELRNNMDYGERIQGYKGAEYINGLFTNPEFGPYKVAAHIKVRNAIIIRYTTGSRF